MKEIEKLELEYRGAAATLRILKKEAGYYEAVARVAPEAYFDYIERVKAAETRKRCLFEQLQQMGRWE